MFINEFVNLKCSLQMFAYVIYFDSLSGCFKPQIGAAAKTSLFIIIIAVVHETHSRTLDERGSWTRQSARIEVSCLSKGSAKKWESAHTIRYWKRSVSWGWIFFSPFVVAADHHRLNFNVRSYFLLKDVQFELAEMFVYQLSDIGCRASQIFQKHGIVSGRRLPRERNSYASASRV